ncbi:GntR family transcriptional regulator [Microbacterium flavum]|uniref:GntR family transcriptional regulator n=1 Tax=Microbacterium flavum TaxID=415216 RepID=A0ABS5XU48_9MICO|nr:GntR family transcriptional regulator [Microbacterium flavum]MBT8798044.1 GntR family transcriptional regulator [Microbacterium flavum]
MSPLETTPLVRNLGARSSIRDRVTDALREAMVAGTMKPDTVYSAPALAQLLGVSATPVREAMLDLVREGHVEAIRNRGYRVVPISDDDMDDIIAIRTLLEVPTVARVAEIATPEQVSALRPIAAEVERTAAEGLLREHITTDNIFHLGLLAIAGNRMIVDEVRRLRGLTRLSALQEMYDEGRLKETAAEHSQLLDLVEAGDATGAAQLMKRHLGHARGVWVGRPEA